MLHCIYNPFSILAATLPGEKEYLCFQGLLNIILARWLLNGQSFWMSTKTSVLSIVLLSTIQLVSRWREVPL